MEAKGKRRIKDKRLWEKKRGEIKRRERKGISMKRKQKEEEN